MKAKFIGDSVCVYCDDKPVKPGDIIDGPPSRVEFLLTRSDFEAVADDPQPEQKTTKRSKK